MTHVGGIGREDRWTCLWVTVANRGRAEAAARLAARGLALGPVTYTRELVLPPRSRLRVPLYVRLRQSGTLEVVVLVGDEPVARYEQGVLARSSERRLVLVVDARGARLPFLVPRGDRGEPLMKVSTTQCTPRDLPGRWVGYDAFDLVALHDVTASALSPRQRQALLDWVKSGGTLVAFVGRFATQYRDPFFEEVLGVRVSGSLPAADLRHLLGPDGKDIEVAGLKAIVAQTEREPTRLIVERQIGCGRAVFVALDAAAADELGKPRWQRRWRRLITSHVPHIDWTGLETPLVRSLEALSGYRTPGLGTVWLAIGSFFVLAVPLNYRICRRHGRLEYAWVAMSVLAIGFALGAHALGLSSRGLAAKRTVISVVRSVEHARTARVTTFVAIYNPVAGDVRYGLTDGSAAVSPVEEDPSAFQARPGFPGPSLAPDEGPWEVQQSHAMALHAPVARPASFTWCRVDHLVTLPEPFEMDFTFSDGRVAGWMSGGAPWRPAAFCVTAEQMAPVQKSDEVGRWKVACHASYGSLDALVADLRGEQRRRAEALPTATKLSQGILAKPLADAVAPSLGLTIGLSLKGLAQPPSATPADRAVSWLFVAPASLRSAEPQTASISLPIRRIGAKHPDGMRGHTRITPRPSGPSIQWYRDATIVCRGTASLPVDMDPAQWRRLIVRVSHIAAPGYTKALVTLPNNGQPPRKYECDLEKPRPANSGIAISIPAKQLPVSFKSGAPTVDIEVHFEKGSPPSTRWSEHHLTLNAYLEVEIPAEASQHVKRERMAADEQLRDGYGTLD